LATDRTL